MTNLRNVRPIDPNGTPDANLAILVKRNSELVSERDVNNAANDPYHDPL
jgi:hypothetical protein